jgi:hypothetical protein
MGEARHSTSAIPKVIGKNRTIPGNNQQVSIYSVSVIQEAGSIIVWGGGVILVTATCEAEETMQAGPSNYK